MRIDHNLPYRVPEFDQGSLISWINGELWGRLHQHPNLKPPVSEDDAVLNVRVIVDNPLWTDSQRRVMRTTVQ